MAGGEKNNRRRKKIEETGCEGRVVIKVSGNKEKASVRESELEGISTKLTQFKKIFASEKGKLIRAGLC